MLLKLAFRNIFRQRRRTAMTLTSIAFGVASLVLAGGFVADVFSQFGEAIIHSQTGHLQVFRKDFMSGGKRQPEKYLMEEPRVLADRIEKIPEVDFVAMRLNFSGLLNNGRKDLGIIGQGIQPSLETRLGTYLNITAGRTLRDEDAFGLLAGEGVAQSLGLHPGDHVTLLISTAEGALNSLEFELVGVFQSYSKDFDARTVRIHLSAAQELLATSGANLLVATLRRTEDTHRASVAVNTGLDSSQFESRTWRELSDFYEKTVQLYDRQFGVLRFIILAMVLLSVANSVNMSVFERMSELGTLQALGNRRWDVFKLIVVENIVLGLIGAIIGVIAGLLLAVAISAIGIPMPPAPNANLGYTARIQIVPLTVFSAFLIGFIATVLAAIFPARRVSGTSIVDALRQGT